MRKLLALLMLLPSMTLAVNPTNHFRGYPWSANVTTTWNKVESTNNIIKQLMLQLRDRCIVAGRDDLGNYETTVPLWAGVKTNYVYMEGSYTQHPHINLQITNTVLNAYSNFAYSYPDPNTFESALTATGQPYVTKELLAFLNTGIIQIAYYYASITNIDNYFNTGVIEIPRFSMASLSLAAGYSNNVSNIVYNAGDQIVSADWKWQTDLPSNGVVTLAALDERAAYISQLKYVLFNGQPCSPFRVGEKKNNWPYAAGHAESENVDDSQYATVTRMPFAWRQTSLDTTRTPGFYIMNGDYPSWTDIIATEYGGYAPDWDGGGYSGNYFMITNLPSDWPNCGWYDFVNADIDLVVGRDNTNHLTWVVTSDFSFPRVVGYSPLIYLETSNSLSMTYNAAQVVTFVANWHVPNHTGGAEVRSGVYGLKIASYWSDSVWSNYPDPYDPPHFSSITSYTYNVETTSRVTTVIGTNSMTNLTTTTEMAKSFYVWGDYLKYSGSSRYSTNVINLPVPEYQVPVTQVVDSVFTNYEDLFVDSYRSNYVSIYDYYVNTGEYIDLSTNHGMEETSGTLTIDNLTIDPSYGYRDSVRQEVYAFKPDAVAIYTNVASTATVWMIGGDINLHDYWQLDTVYDQGHYVSDWANYVWMFDTNAFGFNISTNKYEKVAGYDTISKVDAKKMLLYTNMYSSSASDGQPYGFYAEGYSLHPDNARQFWGVRNCIFIFEYAFTNRY